MVDTLIEHGHIITVDPDRRMIADGAVAVKDGRILAVGTTDELAPRYRATAGRVIDASGMAVLPGIIDVHAHAGHGLTKTIGGGVGNAWAMACAKIYSHHSPPSFWEAEARLAALERLKCGTTTGLSILGGGDGTMRTDRPDYAMAHVAATRSVGIRSVLAIGLSNPEFPRSYTDHLDGDRPTQIEFTDQLDSCRAVIDTLAEQEDDLSIRICLNLSTLKPAMLPADGAIPEFWFRHADGVRALMEEKDTLFTQDGHVGGSVMLSQQMGLLGPRAILSHCIDLEDREIALLAETDTRVVTNPSANMAIRGRCPAIELMDAGVTVLIGSDGTAPDRSADMFRHMQQAMHYHRRHFRDTQILPPGKTLEMVTIDAAHALGLADEIGSLEAGKRADVILVDMNKPHMRPIHMPLWRVISFANGADVDTVMIGGEILMEGRRVATVDETEVMEAAQAEADRAITAAGLTAELDEPRTLWFGTRF